jgi:hypothetical protein
MFFSPIELMQMVGVPLERSFIPEANTKACRGWPQLLPSLWADTSLRLEFRQ